MQIEPVGKQAFHYPGITVLVPEQSEIVAVFEGSDIPKDVPMKTEDFTVIRVIANITMYYRKDVARSDPVKTFDLPIEIRVGYNLSDLMESNCDVKQLKLAYWDGSRWVIISDAKHEYQILPPSTGQVAEAKIWSWVGDPPVVWGK